MNFMNLAIRMCDRSGAVCRPITFGATVTVAERQEIASVLKLPDAVDSMFNNWHVIKTGNLYSATRATWENGGINATDYNSFVERLEDYTS